MLDKLSKVMKGFFALLLAYYLVVLGALFVAALVNFVLLVSRGDLGEASSAYLILAIAGLFIGFLVWMRVDAKATSARLEKRHPTTAHATAEEDQDEGDDSGESRFSENIRPAPRPPL